MQAIGFKKFLEDYVVCGYVSSNVLKNELQLNHAEIARRWINGGVIPKNKYIDLIFKTYEYPREKLEEYLTLLQLQDEARERAFRPIDDRHFNR